jgi:hypothetical protein
MTPDSIDQRWKPISDRPEWHQQPIFQFICIEGEMIHSGERWARLKVGTATVERDGPFEYRAQDIDRLCRDGDMERATTEVTYWMPAVFPQLPHNKPRL